jgi:hypothetical protein
MIALTVSSKILPVLNEAPRHGEAQGEDVGDIDTRWD